MPTPFDYTLLLIFTIFGTVIFAHPSTVVTCGSAVKLVHKTTNYHLHSSNVQWGSGSGEFVATAIPPASSNPNTLWQLQTEFNPATPNDLCPFGNPLKCGDVIRLRHSQTDAFLRSQSHRAPISGRQEVSAEQKGDKTLENFAVQCIGVANGTLLSQDTPLRLKHTRTNKFLYTRLNDNFNQSNCPNCPILNHLEISCHGVENDDTIFTMHDGFYIPINTERIIYDYNNFEKEPKILFNSKTQNELPPTTNGGGKHSHDEL